MLLKRCALPNWMRQEIEPTQDPYGFGKMDLVLAACRNRHSANDVHVDPMQS
jgi:hypothetical protein